MTSRSLGILLVVTMSAQAWAQEPTFADVKRAQALVSELYGDELQRVAKDAVGQIRLANQLLQEAKDTADFPAGRLVLLETSLQLASAGGDLAVALQALEEKLTDLRVPPLSPRAVEEKYQVLTRIARPGASADTQQAIVDTSLVLLEDALAADDYVVSQKLLGLAEKAGLNLKSVALVSAIRKRQDEVKRAQGVYEEWRPFAERLAKTPGDAEAATQMGVYQAMIKGNWDVGLPLLARGKDPELKKLAEHDLAQPKEPDLQLTLALEWLKVAAMPRFRQPHASLRAYHWLQAAASEARDEGLRKRAQQLLNELSERIPAEYRVGEIVAEWKQCEGHQGPVYDAAFSPDGRKAISVGADGTLRLWDVRSGKELRRVDGHAGRLWTVAFASDGRRVVTGGFDNSVRLWDLLSGREVRRLGNHGDYVRDVAFSHDGRLVASAGDDRVIRLWNVETGKDLQTFTGHGHFVWSVAFSRDGQRLLSGSLDRSARLWDVATGKELQRFEGHTDTVLAVDLSPDGHRAVTGSTDRTLRVWDLKTGQVLQTLKGHTGYVHRVSFSPDGRRVLSASQDRTVRLWDVTTGQVLRVLEGHRDQVWSIAFSRDGRLAISAGQDAIARIWAGTR